MKGVPNILFWSEDPSGLVAAHFSSIFFSMLALEGHVSILEAYALTLFATQVGQSGLIGPTVACFYKLQQRRQCVTASMRGVCCRPAWQQQSSRLAPSVP